MPSRFFSHKDKDRKNAAQREQQNKDDLDAFLRPSTENAAAYAAAVAAQKPARPLAPKIDVSAAQRFPSATQVPTIIAAEPEIEEKFRYSKPPRRPGLKVSFLDVAPEVIGFGGDESEEPIFEVTRRRHRNRSTSNARISPSNHPPNTGPPRDQRPRAGSYNAEPSRNPQLTLQDHQQHGHPQQPSYNAQTPEISDTPVSPEWVARESDRIVDMPPYSLDEDKNEPVLPKITRTPTGFGSIHNNPYPASDGSRESSFEVPRPTDQNSSLQKPVENPGEAAREPSPSRRLSHIDPNQRIGLKKMREDEGRAFISAKSPVNSHRPTSSQSSLPLTTSDPRTVRHVRPSFESGSHPSPTASVNSHPSLSSEVPSPPPQTRRSATIASHPPGQTDGSKYYASPSPSLRQGASPRPTSRDRFTSPAVSASNLRPSSRDDSPNSIPSLSRERTFSSGTSPDTRGHRLSPLHDAHSASDAPFLESTNSNRDAEQDAQESALRDAAFFEFASNVSHMRHVFRLSAQSDAPAAIRTLSDWVRAAHWWFLIGRDGMEKALRSKGTETMDMRYSPGRTTFSPYVQHHVNLAKSWWIVSDVISSRIETLKSSSNDAHSQAEIVEADEARNEIVCCLKKLALSLSKRGVVPSREMLAQGLDNTIWIRYPELHPEMGLVLFENRAVSNSKVHIKCTDLPLGDSDRVFSLGRFSVSVLVLQADQDGREHQIQSAFPCILSLFRSHNSFQIGMTIASQSPLVSIVVQNSNEYGATWEHVRWENDLNSLRVKLARKLRLKISFAQGDFNNLWGAYDYSQKVNSSMQRRSDEKFVHRTILREFSYTDTVHSEAFPNVPLAGANAWVFEKSTTIDDGPSASQIHRHYRIAIVTNPGDKMLRSVSIDISRGMPVQYVYSRTERGQPHMELLVNEYNRFRTLGLGFSDDKARDLLRDCIIGRVLKPDEASIALIPDVSMTISAEPSTDESVSVFAAPVKLDFLAVDVVNNNIEPGMTIEPPVIRSSGLRAMLQGRNGTIVDRMNLGQGELKIRLDVDMTPSLRILRNARSDVTLSMGPNAADQTHLSVLQRIQHMITTAPTVNIYSFKTFPDLFAFQHAISGYAVLYDGRANSFAISRRRMMVPVYKKWDTDRARLQIVQQGEIIQLLAFFEGYNLAEAFNFQLRSSDFFEKVDGGKNTHALKLVNAKFSLPLPNSDREREGEKTSKFINLDGLEPPTESEDITIGFEREEERDRFAAALPAAASSGRKFTLMRRI